MSQNKKKPMNNNRIKEVRLAKHKTQKDLANLLGVSDQAVAYYEKALREPPLASWVKMADYLGVSVPYLQGISKYINPETSPESFDNFLNSAASKVDSEGNACFTEKDWRNFVTSFTSQEALNNFRKLYIVVNQLDVPINKIEFDEIIKKIDNLSELNFVTEHVAYVYEILVKSLIFDNNKIKKAAEKIKKIVASSYYEEYETKKD